LGEFVVANVREIVGYNIAWYRKKCGLRQVDVSEMTGINYRYYQDIEAGKRNITLDTLQKISNALNVKIEHLISLERLEIGMSLEKFVQNKMNALDLIPNWMIAIRDENRLIRYINEEMSKFIEIPKSELIGFSLDEQNFIKGLDGLEFALNLGRKGIPSNNFIIEIKKAKSAGEQFIYIISYTLLFKGEYVGFLSASIEVNKYTDQEYRALSESLIQIVNT
jgi:transcriptional regulator with XRE-family HTH domain